MEIPRIPLNINPEKERSYDDYIASEPVGQEEAIDAAFDLAMPDTAVGLIARKLSMNEFTESGVTPISPEEANLRYPGMNTPFREPVNPYAAQMLYDREQEQFELQRKISRGPQDGWTKTKMFGAGLVAHLMDPLEFGAGALSGWALGGLAVRGAFGARAALATDLVGQGVAVNAATRLAVTAGEAVAGAAIENVGQEILTANVEGAEGYDSGRSTGDVFTDIAVGTLAAGALGVGIKEGSLKIKGLMRALKSTSPEADLAVMRNIVQALETDTIPDSTPILKVLSEETSVRPQDVGKSRAQGYEFVPVSPESVKTTKFFVATRDAADITVGERADLGDDYGFGRHLTDNPGVANAAAARSMADAEGAVHEVRITGELNPLPIGATAAGDPTLAAQLSEILGQVMDDADNIVATEPIKNVLSYIRNAIDEDMLDPQTFDFVEGIIRDRGYNALIDDGSSRLGSKHDPHNHIIVLDDSLFERTAQYTPDSGVIKQPSAEDLDVAAKQHTDPNKKFFVDMDQHQKRQTDINEFLEGAREDLKKMSEAVDETLAEIDSLEKQEFYTPQEAAQIKEATLNARKAAEQEITILKAFKDCAGA